MGKKETLSTAELSAGQKKRLDRKKEIAAAKKKKQRNKIIAIVVCAAIVIGACSGIGYSIYKNVSITKPITDYGQGLTKDGKIDGIKVADYIVSTLDYNNISVKHSDIALADKDLESQITAVLNANKFYSKDEKLSAAAGNSVNVNFFCTLNDETQSGIGNAGNKDGLNFTISASLGTTATPTPTATPSATPTATPTATSTPTPTAKPNTYQALFQEEVIGMHPGETKKITVDVPSDFKVGTTASPVAGKTVVFHVTLNSIQQTPEMTDEFVVEKLKEETGCTTVSEYKAYLIKKAERENIEKKVQELIGDTKENVKVTKYPKSYLKTKKGQVRAYYDSMLEYYNALYKAYTGQDNYFKDVYEMTGKKWKELEKDIQDNAEIAVAVDCAYQNLFEKMNLTVTDEDYKQYVLDLGTYKTVEEYNKANDQKSTWQAVMQTKVVDAISDLVKITE